MTHTLQGKDDHHNDHSNDHHNCCRLKNAGAKMGVLFRFLRICLLFLHILRVSRIGHSGYNGHILSIYKALCALELNPVPSVMTLSRDSDSISCPHSPDFFIIGTGTLSHIHIRCDFSCCRQFRYRDLFISQSRYRE